MRGAIVAGVAVAALVGVAGPDAHAADQFRLLQLDGQHVKWGRSVMGAGATVSYAFVAGPMHFEDARNCRDVIPLDGLEQASGIASPVLRHEVAAAFAMWEAAANIAFRPSDDPNTAGILIGAQAKPHGAAYANVSFRKSDGREIADMDRGLICLNPDRSWKVGLGGNPAAYDVRYAIAHEIGHTIGLDHSPLADQMMSFEYNEDFDKLQNGDIAGVIALYGARRPVVVGASGQAAPKDKPTAAVDGQPSLSIR